MLLRAVTAPKAIVNTQCKGLGVINRIGPLFPVFEGHRKWPLCRHFSVLASSLPSCSSAFHKGPSHLRGRSPPEGFIYLRSSSFIEFSIAASDLLDPNLGDSQRTRDIPD